MASGRPGVLGVAGGQRDVGRSRFIRRGVEPNGAAQGVFAGGRKLVYRADRKIAPGGENRKNLRRARPQRGGARKKNPPPAGDDPAEPRLQAGPAVLARRRAPRAGGGKRRRHPAPSGG